MITALSWYYAVARANTNNPATNSFDNWLAKNWLKDRVKVDTDGYNRVNTADTLSKLTKLLTTDTDLLTAGDLANLATISNKAP